MVRYPMHGALEAQVRAARERGEFENLPGQGKPLQLDDLDHLPSEQRLAALLMRNMREVPVAVTLVREIRAFRAAIEHSDSEQERRRILGLLQQKLGELSAALVLEDLGGNQRQKRSR